jgi:hypothetical protein
MQVRHQRCSAFTASALRVPGNISRKRASGAEGAQLRVSKRRVSVVRDAAGRSSGPEWHSRARQASRRGACQLSNTPGRPRTRGRGQRRQRQRGRVRLLFHAGCMGEREDQDDELQCGGGYCTGKQPAVAQSWRRILVVGGRWVLNAGRIICLGRPLGSSRWLAWR